MRHQHTHTHTHTKLHKFFHCSHRSLTRRSGDVSLPIRFLHRCMTLMMMIRCHSHFPTTWTHTSPTNSSSLSTSPLLRAFWTVGRHTRDIRHTNGCIHDIRMLRGMRMNRTMVSVSRLQLLIPVIFVYLMWWLLTVPSVFTTRVTWSHRH